MADTKITYRTTEKIRARSKAWYDKNKSRLNEKTTCGVCGRQYSFQKRARHMKQKKHLKALSDNFWYGFTV
jgi:formate dehydrogenase assembly factor FdhD